MSDPTGLGPHTTAQISQAIANQVLPSDFQNTVEDFYWPLTQKLHHRLYAPYEVDKNKVIRDKETQFIGIQGSQGSGKSTCALFVKLLLELEFGMRVLVISIDDFYLTKSEREVMSETVHPLFMTRGVPGTHDVALIQSVFDKATLNDPFDVPTFNKATDDRNPREHWQNVDPPVDIVIFEGWCVGVKPQNNAYLATPLNRLEKEEDADLTWRTSVNQALHDHYQAIFKRLNILVALQAPSFSCVLGWRTLQEEKLLAALKAQGKSTSLAQTPEQIKRFIFHYQRLTEHALNSMPNAADFLLHLGTDHRFTSLEERPVAT